MFKSIIIIVALGFSTTSFAQSRQSTNAAFKALAEKAMKDSSIMRTKSYQRVEDADKSKTTIVLPGTRFFGDLNVKVPNESAPIQDEKGPASTQDETAELLDLLGE